MAKEIKKSFCSNLKYLECF